MSDKTTAVSQALERIGRLFRATEAENGRLRAEVELLKGETALQQQRIDRLEREIDAARNDRAELVDQVIDWLGQGEEIVRARLPGAAEPKPDDELPPGQTSRAALLTDIAERVTQARERMGTAEFARTFGGREPAGAQ